MGLRLRIRGRLVISVVLALCGSGAEAQVLPDMPGLTFAPKLPFDSTAEVSVQEEVPSNKSGQTEAKEQVRDELKRLSEAVEKLSKNSTISVGEGLNLRIFGTLQGTMTYNSARPVAPGTEMYLLPASPFGFDSPTVDVHARASSIGAILTGPKIGDWETRGLFLVYFYNGNLISDSYGILPYQLWGDIKNEEWRFAAGLQKDIFNPLDPTMLTYGLMYGSGNAGNYRGQLRVERYIKPNDEVQWTLQTGLSEPIATLVSNDLSISEDSGWPNIEARFVLGLGKLEGEGLEARRTLEVGVSGVIGQIRNTDAVIGRQVFANVWGIGADARLKINDRLGVQGELFTGQTIGTYNGAVLQDVNTATRQGIRSSGGWGEFYYYLVPEKLHMHFGYGIDDPRDQDLAPGQRSRNETFFANLIWDATKGFRVGLEVAWRETEYRLLSRNEGVSIQTVIQWSF